MVDRFPILATPSSRHRPKYHRRPRSLSSQRSFRQAPTPLSLVSGATGFLDSPEMPDISDLLSGYLPSRLELADMMCRTSMDDVQRLPAIQPYVASARGETLIRYMSFVSRPALEWKAPRHRPRTIAVLPRMLGPEKCIRCQLRTAHTQCEKHKYLRIGGGFRHSYWYIKKVLDAIEKNERTGLEENQRRLLLEKEREMAVLRAQAEARARADILAAKAKSKKRRIKTYVRTVTGEVVSQYHFLSEKDYKAMKKDKKKAKKLLGLKDDEKLEDFKSSKQAYEENKEGEIVKVKRKKDKERTRYEDKDSRFRDVETVDSGLGRSIREGEESRVSRYTATKSKQVKWDGLSDHSNRAEVVEERRSKKEKKKKRSRKKEDITVVQTEETTPWDHDQSSSDSDSDSDDQSKRRKRKKKKRKKERRKEKKQQRRRDYDFASDGEQQEKIPQRRSRMKSKQPEKPTRDRSWSPNFGSDNDRKESKKKPRRRKQRVSDSDSSEEPRRRRRKRKEKPPKSASNSNEVSGSGSSSEEESYGSESESSSSDNSSGSGSSSTSSSSSTNSDSSSESSSSTSSSSTSSSSSSSSSEVSDVSSPSDVSSSDVSDIEDIVNEEERQIKMEEKKQNKVLLKRAERQEKKIEAKKVEKEARKEVKIEKKIVKEQKKQVRKERREVRREEKNQRHQERRQEKLAALSVSDVSVSSVSSNEISDVDETLDAEEKEAALATKKALVKAQKSEQKLIEKKEEKLEEIKQEKKREKENKKMKRKILKELKRANSVSSVSSVHSSQLSNLSDLEGVDDEEKNKIVEEKKEEKQKQKKVVKMFQKAVKKVITKNVQEAEDWDYDDMIDDSGIMREARRKKEFKYLLPKEAVNSMVKMSKGSRGLTEVIKKTDGRGMEWFDEWQKKRDEEKALREQLDKEKNAEDGLLNLLKSPKDISDDSKTKAKPVSRRKKKQQRYSDDDSDSSEEESASNVSERQVKPRRNRRKAPQEDTDQANETTTEIDPPSSPSELGKIRGVRRVNRMFKEKPDIMQAHLKLVLDTASELNKDDKQVTQKEQSKPNNSKEYEVKHTSIDYVSHYRLIEASKIEPFGRAFVVEDEDNDCWLDYEELRSALDGVQSIAEVKHKQLEYVLKVLGIDEHTKVTFKMFAVVTAVCERMCSMDPFGKYLVDQSDLMDIERKMTLYKSMFYCNTDADYGKNHVTTESVRIDLIAGGLNREQERYVMSRMKANDDCEISFFDYMAYIPLFLSVHDNIIDNPLDMSTKYHNNPDKNTPVRDMNPLGLPLKPAFFDYPKEIHPSGIPLGRPVLHAQNVEPEQTLEATLVDVDKAESVASLSTRPPSERSRRLPSISSRQPSAMSSRTATSAKSWLSESLP